MCHRCDTARRRQKALLDFLRNGVATSDQIAAKFGVCPRTVYRDITILRKRGARIEGAAGVGYMLRRERARP